MKKRRARIYDAFALLTAILVLVLDQWTKMWVVINLSPSFLGPRIFLIGNYLTLYYIRNNGAAFSLFANSIVLVLLIAVAIGVIGYLYIRNINTGSLWYKLIFGLIIGGALSNLIDRARHGGYVVDFISFNIPQLNFQFAVFNLADAAISVGVVLLFVSLLLGSFLKPESASKKTSVVGETTGIPPCPKGDEILQSSKDHDVRN